MEVEDYLPIFIRDDLVAWQVSSKRPPFQDQQLKDHIRQNMEILVKRIQSMSCKQEREEVGF